MDFGDVQDNSLKKFIILASVNLFGGVIFGYTTGIMAYVIPAMEKYTFSSLGDFTFEQGLVTCSLLIGCLIGALFSPTFGEIVSKKKLIFGIGLVTVIGSILTAVSVFLSLFVITRQILGLAVGVASVVCPTYVGELAPRKYSGALGASFQVSITGGIFISYFVGLLLSNWQYGWNMMLLLAVIPGSLLCVLFFFIPDAPSDNKPINHDAIEKYQAAKPSGIALYTVLLNYPKALFLGVTIAVALQFTGINAVFYYATTIFTDAGFGASSSNIATFGLGFWNFISTFIAIFLVDRVGRKPLVITGLILQAISSITLGFIFQFVSNESVSGIASVVLLLVYILGFEAGIGSLFWPLLSEIFPEEAVQGGASLMNGLQWTFNILLTLFFPTIADFSPALAFWLFGGVGVISIVILFLYLKETGKKQSVEAVEEFEGIHSKRLHPDEHVFPSDTDTPYYD